MPRLSLCMIARNEEAMLGDCLASVRGAVDEIVLVDTGSVDRTREIARAAGARVLERAWSDDFAAPRNLSLAEARGDYVLVLDADERLASRSVEALCSVLREADPGFDGGMVRLHNAARTDATEEEVLSGAEAMGEPQPLARLFRNVDGLRYTGAVHETVAPWLARRGFRIRFLPIDLLHLGSSSALRDQRGKRERNIRLLHKQAEADPDDPTPWGYLASELLEGGEAEAARRAAEEGWRRRGRYRGSGYSVLRLAVARARLQLDAGDGAGLLATVEEAGTIDGAHPDLEMLRGCAHELLAGQAKDGGRAAQLEAAVAAYSAARALAGRDYCERFVAGAESHAGATRQGIALLGLGRPAEALLAFDAALSVRPRHLEARLGRVEARIDLGEGEGAFAAIEPLLDERPDGWVLAAAIALQLGGSDEARALLTRAGERAAATGFLSPHRRARFSSLLSRLAKEEA